MRLFYLEGRSYEEISTELHIPVNTLGPILTRARQKMRREGKGAAAVGADAAPVDADEAGEADEAGALVGDERSQAGDDVTSSTSRAATRIMRAR